MRLVCLPRSYGCGGCVFSGGFSGNTVMPRRLIGTCTTSSTFRYACMSCQVVLHLHCAHQTVQSSLWSKGSHHKVSAKVYLIGYEFDHPILTATGKTWWEATVTQHLSLLAPAHSISASGIQRNSVADTIICHLCSSCSNSCTNQHTQHMVNGIKGSSRDCISILY